MSTMQVRNVPEDVAQTLKARAAAQGSSLSDYLLGELTLIARRPTRDEMVERLTRSAVPALTPAAEEIAAARGDR